MRYAEVRRAAWLNFTNPESIDFKLRLHSMHPDIVSKRETYMNMLNNDPDIHVKAASAMNNAIDNLFESLAICQ